MQKTRKWIVLFTVFIIVWFLLDYLLYSGYPEPGINEDIFDSFFIVPNPYLESFVAKLVYTLFPDVENLEDTIFLLSFLLIILYDTVIYIGSVFLNVYFMFKWTTQYNIKNFKHKSRRDWKTANNMPSAIQNIKAYSKSAVSSVKDVGHKIADKTPSDKIKTTGADLGKKITESAKSITSHEVSDQDKREQIREWHDLMVMGVISQSEFDQKKAEILKRNYTRRI